MRRLSALDASFLRLESPSAHMHVGWLATLRLPEGCEELDVATLKARMAAHLHLAPRFRHKVVWAPVGEPVWVDDTGFDIDRHVVCADAGKTCGEGALREIADGFLSGPLDRSRPLWSLLVVPRVSRGRAAVIGKVHHAMVDGVAAVELGTLLFDLSPDEARPEPVEWGPDPGVGPLRLAVDAVADAALEQFRAAGRLAAMGLAPRRSLRIAETMRRAALSLAEDAINPAPGSFLNVPIGPRRTLVTRAVSFRRLERLKREQAVKLNDMVLAVVAGALRRLAVERGELPDRLRAMVPVSVRDSAAAPGEGNRITFAFVDLPIGEPEPLRRLALIHAETAELKRSGRIAGSHALLEVTGQLPGFLKERAARLAASPRMYNLTISNVPGPRAPLYAAGAEVEAVYPVVPMSEEHALSVGVLSYRGRLHFSAYADPDALGEAAGLGGLLLDAVSELERAVRAGRSRGRRRAGSPHVSSGARRAGTPVESQSTHPGSSKPAYS